MKRILVCLVLLTCAGVASADSPGCKCGKEKKAKAKNGKAVVTGSQIPVKVDKQGRPVNSTLKVDVVDEPTIRTFGFGSPLSTLQRIPYAYTVGNNRRGR